MLQHVAIQGFKGSFHEVAARQYFGVALALNFCATFGEVVTQVADGRADAALMAMENSLAGSILPNYLLLERADLTITGEVYLPIHQHLLVLPGTPLADIQSVHSHPMALRQCGDFLSQHPHWQLVETEDTGLSAQLLAERRQRAWPWWPARRPLRRLVCTFWPPPSTTTPATIPAFWCWSAPPKPGW